MNRVRRVQIVEVALRDGLQSVREFVPTEEKLALVRRLINPGVRRIEATAFVSPRWVPQMSDAEQLMARVPRGGGTEYMALVVNERGYQRALAARVDWLCYVVAATEAISRSNANMSLREALELARRVIAQAKKDGLRVRGSIGVAWVCPYEGEVPAARTLDIAAELILAGADEISFNDTTGKATPERTYALFAEARGRWPHLSFAAHLHDTTGMALDNIKAAMKAGVAVFDAAVGGLGGCPFTPGAPGNVATERVVAMLEELGVETDIDLRTLREIARDYASWMLHPSSSRSKG